jgi:hypothetical protein
MLVVLVGCATHQQPGVPPVSASPVSTVYYSALSGECPTLDSPEAKRFTGSRKGRLLPSPPQQEDYQWINCSWRLPSGAPWVTVLIKIYRDGFAPTQTAHGNAEIDVTDIAATDAARVKTDKSGAFRAIERTTPSGRAAMSADGTADSLLQTTAVGNVSVTVMLFKSATPGANASARADALIAQLATIADAMTAEIAGQLVAQR